MGNQGTRRVPARAIRSARAPRHRPRCRSVWTANAFDGTISRIHLGSGQTTTIPVGATPNDLTFANGLIWVTID